MKIAILTYYGVHNHGAVLQANALKTVLESYGHDVEFLEFHRNYDYIPVNNAKKYKISLSSIPFYTKYLFEKGLGNILYNLKKNRILSNFRKENFVIKQRYSDFAGDIIIIGSDEVFSFEIGINPFFFGHALKANKIFSYGGCFGPTTEQILNDNNLVNLVKSGFANMCSIGVRDMNSKNIADKLSDKESVLVCDPVILYGYKKEQKAYTPKNKNYILIYSYDKNMNNNLEVESIRKYAKSKNLKIYSVGYHHKWCDKNINVTPEELLGYIKNADLVVTDTFHGSVLSIICNTQFFVKMRNNTNKVAFLLEEYNLTDRIINNFDEIEKTSCNPIDFSKVNKIVENRREDSIKFLENAIGVKND